MTTLSATVAKSTNSQRQTPRNVISLSRFGFLRQFAVVATGNVKNIISPCDTGDHSIYGSGTYPVTDSEGKILHWMTIYSCRNCSYSYEEEN